jgi:L-ascorbate metabolism protein UlaG (beta-lactamase superfamily)
MALSKNVLILILVTGSIVTAAAVVVPTVVVLNNNSTIEFTLLYNAGVMIEAKGLRIYIDPYNLPSNQSDYPADAVLITHDHGDHCSSTMLNLIEKEDTQFYFPTMMTSFISWYNGTAVKPGDTFNIGPISVTCFYMYTVAPEGYEPSHPPESNYTSYLIDIDGFTFFHAGDSANIPEYSQLDGLVDVALLPLGPGCQTMTGIDVVNAIDVINPQYFVPIHYAEGADITFINDFGTAVENCGCEIVHLNYFESTKFKI